MKEKRPTYKPDEGAPPGHYGRMLRHALAVADYDERNPAKKEKDDAVRVRPATKVGAHADRN